MISVLAPATRTPVRLRRILGLCDSYHAPRLNNYGGFVGTPLTCLTNRIAHGDCIRTLRRLPNHSADLVLTDPPYLVRYTDREGRTVPNDDNDAWLRPAFTQLYRVLKPNSYCVSFYGWSKAERFLSAWKECGFQPVGHFVWVKSYASKIGRVKMMHEQAYLLAKGNPPPPRTPPPDVLPWLYTGNRLHPTQKPIGSLKPLIEAFAPRGGIVVDAFAGSGSTGVAARDCGRKFILIEQDAAYFRAAQARLN